MPWNEKNSDASQGRSTGTDINRKEEVDVVAGHKSSTSTDDHSAVNNDIQLLEKTHQWDPNLPLEQLEALKLASKAGNRESILTVQNEFIDDSPYEEVRAAVRNTDDGSVANTVRAWILGMLFVTIIAAINMFLSMRSPAITVPTVVVILLVYPVGELWARVVPMRKFRTFGVEWTFNPGPWTIKEHTVVTLMANVTSGYPYSTNALEALQAKSLYNHNMGWGTLVMPYLNLKTD